MAVAAGVFQAGPRSGMLVLRITGSLLAFGRFFLLTVGGSDHAK